MHGAPAAQLRWSFRIFRF